MAQALPPLRLVHCTSSTPCVSVGGCDGRRVNPPRTRVDEKYETMSGNSLGWTLLLLPG